MSDPGTILIFLVVVLVALLVVSYVNQRQTRARVVAQKIAQLKRRVAEMEEMSAVLESMVDSLAIPASINNEAIELLDTIAKLEPESHFCEAHYANAEQRAEELSNPERGRRLYRVQTSDAAIARAQYLINEAAKILRKRQARGKLELSEMEGYINELAWANLMVVTTTHIAQGHKCVNRGEVLKAYAFYRKAQQVLIQSGLSDDRRHQMIREVSEIMSNRRRSVSAKLMPETEFNPAEDAASLPSAEEMMIREQMGNITPTN